MDLVSSLGTFATSLFIIAAASQALKSYRDGHSRGVSHGLVISLLIGFSCMLVYIPVKVGWNWLLMTGYIGQLAAISVVAKYKYWERKDQWDKYLEKYNESKRN